MRIKNRAMGITGKKMTFLLPLLCCLIQAPVGAHPAATDPYGCHECPENCPQWGLVDGQYHCHPTDPENQHQRLILKNPASDQLGWASKYMAGSMSKKKPAEDESSS